MKDSATRYSLRALRGRAAVALTWRLLKTRSPTARASKRQKAACYRKLWCDAAASIGVPVHELPDGDLEITTAAGIVRMHGMQCLIDSAAVTRAAVDKPLVSARLAAAGIRVAPHQTFSLQSLHRALRFLAEAPGECVVKPAAAARGAGVTTSIRCSHDVSRAAAAAAAAGTKATGTSTLRHLARIPMMLGGLSQVPLLIEHQVHGTDYRLLYLDNALIDAIQRQPPTLVGDGRATVRTLLARLNRDRLDAGGVQGQGLVSSDLELGRTLGTQGLTLDSVPGQGKPVRLKSVINENAPEDNRPARAEICQSIIEDGARAARLLGARFAGVDVITTDPGVPLAECGGYVLEVNLPPGLAMHYHGHPGAVEPAKVLLRYLSNAREPETVE